MCSQEILKDLDERSGKIWKDLESAEIKEKSNFRFCNHYFFGVIVVFVLKMTPIFDEFSPITRKIKIVEFFKLFFQSIQHIPHLSKSF